MFLPFLYELRSRKVPVGTQEALALAQALEAGLHDSSLDGFYDVSRALLVHSERHLDAFDQAFAKVFAGVESTALEIHQQLLEWVAQARGRLPELTAEEKALLDGLDREALEQLLQERLREQRERHDGGKKWVGTRGSSPFGHSGVGRDGVRVGGTGGNRRAFRVAGERQYQGYRDDLVLDVRQLGIALRKLRLLAREGQSDEIDLDGTIDQTAKNLGELEVVLRPPKKSNTRVILLMDVGGSMDPFAHLVSRLFTAAKKATHFRELRIFYFHNCLYGRVYEQPTLRGAVPLSQLFAQTDKRYKLIVVGDALMAPWELMDRSGWSGEEDLEGITWMMRVKEHFPHSVWLNPEPQSGWAQTTIEVLRRVFDMYPLTLEGLSDAVGQLTRRR